MQRLAALQEIAEGALRMSIDMGERLGRIEALLACQSGHSDAEMVAVIRAILAEPCRDPFFPSNAAELVDAVKKDSA